MTFTYDINNVDDKTKVRLLISDVEDANHIFEDEELAVFLGLEGTELLAAARALEVIAGNEVMVQKRIQILDLRTDGPAEAEALLKIAGRYRESSDALESDEADFEVVSLHTDQFSSEQLRWNQIVEMYSL